MKMDKTSILTNFHRILRTISALERKQVKDPMAWSHEDQDELLLANLELDQLKGQYPKQARNYATN
jgi:hypothetical protein